MSDLDIHLALEDERRPTPTQQLRAMGVELVSIHWDASRFGGEWRYVWEGRPGDDGIRPGCHGRCDELGDVIGEIVADLAEDDEGAF